MESKAALVAAKQNAEALARARQEYDDEEDEDKDAIVVDLEDSECSTGSIDHSKIMSHRKRSHSESNNDDVSVKVGVFEPVQPKKVTFRELGMEIGRRWKALQELGESSQKLTEYRALAEADAARYQSEMAEYHRQKIRSMCRGGNLGHRFNEARETVEAQQAMQAEAVAAMKAAMEMQQKECSKVQQNTTPAQAQQCQAQPVPNAFPGAAPGMMPMMMMMANPFTGQMTPCMVMMAAPEKGATGTAMAMPMMGMPVGTMPLMTTTTSKQQEVQPKQAQPTPQVQLPSPPKQPIENPQNQDGFQAATIMPEAMPLPIQFDQQFENPSPPQPERKGFFPSIGPSLEILEEFDEFPTEEDPLTYLPAFATDNDAVCRPMASHQSQDPHEPPTKKPKMCHQKQHDERHLRPSGSSVDTNNLMNNIAKAFGEDWDPTPIKIPQNILLKTKNMACSSSNSILNENFDKMMESLETYNYDSDVSGFHDLFEGADIEYSKGQSKEEQAKPFFPLVEPVDRNEPIFDSRKESNGCATTAASITDKPFFPTIDTKAAVEGGFLNNSVAADISTLNKMALFHGRSNGPATAQKANASVVAPSTSDKEIIDLTADDVIGNLQELIKRQEEILGIKL